MPVFSVEIDEALPVKVEKPETSAPKEPVTVAVQEPEETDSEAPPLVTTWRPL